MTRQTALFSEALDIVRGQAVSFVGGGGKTTAILTLARELKSAGWRVLASTTTRVGGRVEQAMPVIFAGGFFVARELRDALDEHGAVFLAEGRTPDGKLAGVAPELLTRLAGDGMADAILVEADGARQLPLKAPGQHEPVVPACTNLLVPMAGLDALGRPVDDGSVHRPDAVRSLSDSLTVTEELISDVLTSGEGGLKGAPPGAVVRPVLNKAAAETDLAAALRVASLVLAKRPDRIDRVLVTDLLAGQHRVVEGPRC